MPGSVMLRSFFVLLPLPLSAATGTVTTLCDSLTADTFCNFFSLHSAFVVAQYQ